MRIILILITAFSISGLCLSQDSKKLSEKIIELEKRIALLEKRVDEIAKTSQPTITTDKLFNIKYEIESEDKETEFLIMYWDKDAQPRGAWARSGWKFTFSTTDVNQNVQIQGKPSGKNTKKLTVKVYVNNKLIKADSKELKLTSTDGPYCQVLLSEL